MSGHRAWRLKFDTSHSNYCACSQLQLRAVPGGPDQTQGAPGAAFADSSYDGSLTPDHAFSGVGFWHSGNDGGAGYIGWDFGAGATIDVQEIAYRNRNDGYDPNATAIQTGGVEYSDDLVTWTRLFSVNPPDQNGWGNGETRIFDYNPAPSDDARGSQLAMVVVANDQGAPSAGANAAQIALVCVDKEYQLPLHLHGWPIYSIWGFPYWIEG